MVGIGIFTSDEVRVEMKDIQCASNRKDKFHTLTELALIELSLPHSNADAEGSFSILREIWDWLQRKSVKTDCEISDKLKIQWGIRTTTFNYQRLYCQMLQKQVACIPTPWNMIVTCTCCNMHISFLIVI